jgi:hypothetical protein
MRNENDKDAATDDATDDATADTTDEQGADAGEQHSEYGQDDDHIYVDRDKIDFDPEDGLLAGTAVDGTSEIPGSPSNPDDDGPGEDSQDDDHSDDDSSDAERDRGADDTSAERG